MANSLLTGVSGLRVHQQLLDVVGHNLANTNTTGFKSQRVRFADLLYQTISPATSSTATTGGTNPIQPGLGVRTQAIDTNLGQGGIETTGGNLDLAIQGNGFFVVSNGTTTSFTRAGAFGVDQQNYLVDSGSGLRVQRFGTVGEGDGVNPGFQAPDIKDIRIPFGAGIPGQATQSVTFTGNLSANTTGPLAQTLTSPQPLLAGGAPATAATPLNGLDGNTVPYAAGDQLTIQGTARDGTAVNATFPVAGAATTVGDLLTFLNGLFPGSTAVLDAAGNLVVTDSAVGPSRLNLTLNDSTAPAQVGSTRWANYTPTLTTAGKNGDTVSTAIQVYDTQGTGHNLSLVFQKTANNTWDLTAALTAGEGTLTDATVSGITFNQDGSFQQVTGTGAGDINLVAEFTGLPTPQRIQLNLGAPNDFNGLTQFGGTTSAAATVQDGFAAGSLATVSVSQNGTISGVFTNGRTLALAQLAIATFANPGGLNRDGGNLFSVSAQSGDPLIAGANSGGRGTIQQGALESSNVDVAQEFTRLIIAQRGFQVNARTITVTDQVLQEMASIIR